MRIINDRLDLSKIDPLSLLTSEGIDKAATGLLPKAMLYFAEVGSVRICTMLCYAERHAAPEQIFLDNVLNYMQRAPEGEVEAIRGYLKAKLRTYARSSGHWRWN